MSQQSEVYGALKQAGVPMTLGQIARMVRLNTQGISSAVSKLRMYGYIEIASEVRMGYRNIRTYRPTAKPYIPQPMGHP